ncbi:hypothetical protein MVEN_02208200 [Mycena venus]|uniref:Uncharacterized protein n=1 Tax=Mycena venus TaxID=2733690 RepID=A0A8H6X6Y1_9AGAR|nr:hypothetical protein MVEN_02208200 [Mycena venus]
MALQTSDIEKFLSDNYSSSKASDGEEVHVYTVGGVDSSNPDRHNYDVNVPLWGVTWILKGYVDTKLAMDATFSIKVPILPTIKLADVKGNLADGIAVAFNVSGVVNGQAKFYTSDKWVYINLAATVFGTAHGPVDFKLFPLPTSST